MGRDWEFGHVQAGDVGGDGAPERYAGAWVGLESGETDDD